MPDGFRSKEGFLILDEKLSAGNVTPAQIVIEGDIISQPVQDGIERLKTAMATDKEKVFALPQPLEVNKDGTIALLTVPVAGDSAEDEAQGAIRRLCQEYVPAAFGSVPETVSVTGETAYNMDFFDTANNAVFYIFPIVLGMSFPRLPLHCRAA